MKTTTKQQYDEMVKQASPNSPVLRNCLCAFFFGGLVCTIGQALFVLFHSLLVMAEQDARACVSLCLITVAALLTALGVYDNIARHAGAGLIVPITGFANSIVSSAIEFKSEGFITGIGARLFSIAGPVLVYGCTASILYGIVYFVMGLF